MMSSKQRTYGRKRKDAAEDKFDALFGTDNVKKKITVEIGDVKKRKKSPEQVSPSKYLKIANGTTIATVPHSNSKVISLPNLVGKKTDDKFCIAVKQPPTFSKAKQSSNFGDTGNVTRLSYGATKTTCVQNSFGSTKYDMLFKKNEKCASDKFDALFGEELGSMQHDMKQSQTTKEEPEPAKNHDYDTLFGFANNRRSSSEDSQSETIVGSSATSIDLERIQRLSPTKKTANCMSGITAATMKTVGGKVVLNIHKKAKSPKNSNTTNYPFSPPTFSDSNNHFASNNFPSQTNVCKPKHDSINKEKGTDRSAHDKTVFSHKSLSSSQVLVKKQNMDFTEKLQNSTISLATLKSKDIASSQLQTPKLMPFRHNKEKMRKPISSLKPVSTSKPSYNSRPWISDADDSYKSENMSQSQPDSQKSEPSSAPVTPKLTRSVTWPNQVGESIITSIKCDKAAKSYYTVVKHVKNYQNCLEEGETKEIEDEIAYLLEGLQSSQPISVRCLSVTNLASKCQQHNFRLYLRAHNISDKIFSHLQDAKDNQDLALSTAALMFMLSRDRQVEISKSTLQLLLRLVDPFDKSEPQKNSPKTGTNGSEKKSESKYKFFRSKDKNAKKSDNENVNLTSVNKIREMVDACEDHLLSSNDISVKRLSSEALIRFTARRTTEWFREEVRIKGGLDHIILLVKQNVELLESMYSITFRPEDFKPSQSLCLLERLLKVLENAIVNSPRNAMYLVTHQRALLLKKMASLMRLCKKWLYQFPFVAPEGGASDAPSNPYTHLHNAVLQIIKLLVNVSNDNEWVSSRVGEQEGMLLGIVECVLVTPEQLKEEHKYELILLSLSLLVNLVESSAKNRMALMKITMPSKSNFSPHGDGTSHPVGVVQALVKLFAQRQAAASENEILGESGVKKAVEAKKTSAEKQQNESRLSETRSDGLHANESDGHWVDTEDGIEWVPSEDADAHASLSQESFRSNASSTRNPEDTLTAEEKNEMKETLDKANEHMEDSIVASYAALVLGCLIHGNRANSSVIRSFLDSDGFAPMIRMLKKFLSFMSLTAGMSVKGEKTLTQIIEVIEEENLLH